MRRHEVKQHTKDGDLFIEHLESLAELRRFVRCGVPVKGELMLIGEMDCQDEFA